MDKTPDPQFNIFIPNFKIEDEIVDESLIPLSKQPSIYPAENGLNLPEIYDPSWRPD
jgi:hypothetical protein